MSEPRVCVLCNESVVDGEHAEWRDRIHRACAMRSAMGGIGHLIAHEYWCLQRGDPDAGLTYRQSSLLADEFVAVVGIEEAARRA